MSQRPVHLKKLIYTGIEGFPLRHGDLSQIIGQWQSQLPLTRELLSVYPLPVKGIYRFEFDFIELNLIFMRLDEALDELEPRGCPLFDCLFLDGFAPSKNQEMWRPSVLRRLSYLCRQGASFSTFTAASRVRRCLIHCGFKIIRQKGFGRKREMLTGTLDRENRITYKPRKPWYHYGQPKQRVSQPVVIIGGGIAGCASANALAKRGIECLIIEQNDAAGGTAASLGRCNYSALLTADFNNASRFYWHAYHHLVQHVANFPANRHQQCGIFYIADTPARKRYLSAADKILGKFDSHFCWVTENQTKSVTGISINYPGLFTRCGGWLNGQFFCDQLTQHRLISVKTGTTATRLTRSNTGWQIDTSDQCLTASHVILCTGWARQLTDAYDMCRLETLKGQATPLLLGNLECAPTTILNNGHYLIPGTDDSNDAIVGASFEPDSELNNGPTTREDLENLAAIRHLNPELAAAIDDQAKAIANGSHSSGNTGFRLTTRDRMPLIGAVPDMTFYQTRYPPFICSGRLKNCPDPQHQPGLYVNTAHGSRGLTASILSGKLITALITGDMSPLPRSLVEAVHPARFFVRDHLASK